MKTPNNSPTKHASSPSPDHRFIGKRPDKPVRRLFGKRPDKTPRSKPNKLQACQMPHPQGKKCFAKFFQFRDGEGGEDFVPCWEQSNGDILAPNMDLGEALSRFLQEPTSDNCEQLLDELEGAGLTDDLPGADPTDFFLALMAKIPRDPPSEEFKTWPRRCLRGRRDSSLT